MRQCRFGATSTTSANPSPALQRASVSYLTDNICKQILPQKLLSQMCTDAPGAVQEMCTPLSMESCTGHHQKAIN